MVWIDIVLLILILWFAYKGFRNGLIIEMTTLVALLLAVWGALKYSNITSKLLHRHLDLQGDYIPFLSFAVTFLLILIVVTIIGRILTKVSNIAQLGILNRLLGAVFGTAKILIILCLFVNGLDRINKHTNFINQKTINESFLYQPLNGLAEKIYDFSDQHFDKVKEKVNETLEDIDKTTV